MTSRATLPAATALLLVTLLSGCAPAPAPTPTATPAFSTEAEAFAAAEETYRSYVEALNARRADPTAPNPQSYLVGEALELDIETQQKLDQAGLTLVGRTTVSSVTGIEASEDLSELAVSVCLDSTGTRVLDESGADVSPPDRENNTGLRVSMNTAFGALLISDSDLLPGQPC